MILAQENGRVMPKEDKIFALNGRAKKMIEEKGLNVDIEVDGGITRENLPIVLDAGANVIVAGSAVFRGDITQNVREMMAILDAARGDGK